MRAVGLGDMLVKQIHRAHLCVSSLSGDEAEAMVAVMLLDLEQVLQVNPKPRSSSPTP
jgi:hypothetical protein